MKKKILFIINNLNCGGAEKALISLLETIDYKKYEVNLYLFKHEGIFISKIPNQVKILEEPKNYCYFDMPFKIAILSLLKNKKFKFAFARIISCFFFKYVKTKAVMEQRVWKYLSMAIEPLNIEYDIAIGFLEKNPIYFCIEKVKAKIKIGWIHNDYEQLNMNKDIDNRYFRNLDYIFTVSDECSNVLKRVFPQYCEKIKVMHNIVSVEIIKKLSLEKCDDVVFNRDKLNIVSVGRLAYQKGFDMAIEACAILKEKGYKINWFVLGEGHERECLNKLIKKYNLKDDFFILGLKENPYSYIAKADLYVQPSRFEGKSIAIDEAKILKKPIVVTNFSTAQNQIKNNENGLICEMNANSLAYAIEVIHQDLNLKNKFITYLSKNEVEDKGEIEKLYEVLV